MISLLLLAACAQVNENNLQKVVEATDTASSLDSPEDTPPYVVDEDPVQPALTLDQVSLAVSDAIRTARWIDGTTLFSGYAASLAHRTASCPYTNPDYVELYAVDYWYDSCTTSDGTTFNGTGYGYLEDDYLSGATYYSNRDYFYGDATITTADGRRFLASGNASFTHYDDTTYDYGVISLSTFGTFTWDDPAADGTWLAAGVNTTFSVYAVDYRAWGGRILVFDGGVARLDGTTNAFLFDQLVAANATYGSPCEEEPGGAVSVRDELGDWYDVYFDGAAYGSDVAFPPECDGCGHVWFRGAWIGDVCPDLSLLLDWEEWAW